MALLDLIDSINGFDCDYETQKGGFQTKKGNPKLASEITFIYLFVYTKIFGIQCGKV